MNKILNIYLILLLFDIASGLSKLNYLTIKKLI